MQKAAWRMQKRALKAAVRARIRQDRARWRQQRRWGRGQGRRSLSAWQILLVVVAGLFVLHAAVVVISTLGSLAIGGLAFVLLWRWLGGGSRHHDLAGAAMDNQTANHIFEATFGSGHQETTASAREATGSSGVVSDPRVARQASASAAASLGEGLRPAMNATEPAGPTCMGPGCNRPATRHSHDGPWLWCDRCAGPDDVPLGEPTPAGAMPRSHQAGLRLDSSATSATSDARHRTEPPPLKQS